MIFQCLLRYWTILVLLSQAATQTLNIVAHQDDDLLFLSPDLINDIASGRSVRTVFLTAGDAGNGRDYWISRQAGSQAAYSKMVGVENSWHKTEIDGYPAITVYYLAESPDVSLAFMNIPDGNRDGSGFYSTGYQSLQKLYQGDIAHIQAVDGSVIYTVYELIATLTAIMNDFSPDRINTQDYAHSFGDGDHSDHYATGYLVKNATQSVPAQFDFVGYLGYSAVSLDANLDASDLEQKKVVFYTYAEYDGNTCASDEACLGREESDWLPREYTIV